MKKASWGFLALALATSPAISYFKYQRQLRTVNQGGQHYAVVDEAVWQHALPDLDDLRLYAGGNEIPYARRTMWGSRETEQKNVRLLQPSTIGGKTQFLLDMAGVSEYDRIALMLATKNYVVHALVEGQDDSHGKQWANLGTTTLFDLSQEKLGHNTTLQIPVSTFKYLRVTVDNLVKPSDVQNAAAGIERAQEAVWRDLGGEPIETQEGKDTILAFAISADIPVERLMLAIDPAQENFQREIEIQSEKGSTTAVGEITRVHLQRNGEKIDVDRPWLSLSTRSLGHLRAVIHNGDDAPLKIVRARLQQYERRIYFDCDAGIALALYYGDGKLGAPVYDYAKLFQVDANAVQLGMGDEVANAGFTGRPDDRAWSERHPAVLWAAILAAVAILGGVAVRSIKAGAS